MERMIPIENCTTEQERILFIQTKVRELTRNGSNTIGVICPSAGESARLLATLKWKFDVRMHVPGSNIESGITILPAGHSQFEEFDVVIVPEDYPIPTDQKSAAKSASAQPKKSSSESQTASKHVAIFDSRTVTSKSVASSSATSALNTAVPQRTTKHFITGRAGTSLSSLANAVKPTPKAAPMVSSECGTMPTDTSQLRPEAHGRIDHSIREIKTSAHHLEITASYGVLTLIPVAENGVRVIFRRGISPYSRNHVSAVDLTDAVNNEISWEIIENGDAILVKTTQLQISVGKKTGHLSFMNTRGEVLLSENPQLPRQYSDKLGIWWNYYSWGRKEYLKALGDYEKDWVDIGSGAKYVSHTELTDKQPTLITSAAGYQIEIAPGSKVLVCTINAYSPHIRYEDCNEIDYVFRVMH